MRDSIYTIPVNEMFEPKTGCPLCAMRDMLESRCVEYIMGAAMMEPDVRMETNRIGFCKYHLDRMHERRNRLSLALMLETHLAELQNTVFKKRGVFSRKKAEPQASTCYVCDKIDWAMERQVDTIFRMYAESSEFRTLFSEQETFCMEHYRLLAQTAPLKLNKKQLPDFMETLNRVTLSYLEQLKEDVTHFTKMFDYRNSGADADWGNSKDSIERAMWFLTSRK